MTTPSLPTAKLMPKQALILAHAMIIGNLNELEKGGDLDREDIDAAILQVEEALALGRDGIRKVKLARIAWFVHLTTAMLAEHDDNATDEEVQHFYAATRYLRMILDQYSPHYGCDFPEHPRTTEEEGSIDGITDSDNTDSSDESAGKEEADMTAGEVLVARLQG